MSWGNARTVSERCRRFGGNEAQWHFFLCHSVRKGLFLTVSYLWFIWQCISTDQQLYQALYFIIVERGYKICRTHEESVSLGLHFPACSSALGSASMTLVSALDLNDSSGLCTTITGGRICPYPFSFLYTEHRDPAVPRTYTGSAPELPG